MGIRDFIERARKAQQDNPQKHDVQLELCPEPITLWASEGEILAERWREIDAEWEDWDLTYDPEHAKEDAERKGRWTWDDELQLGGM